MHRTTRRGWLAAAGATAVAGLAGCAGVGGSSEPVALGSLLPLSGPGALGDVAADHERAVAAAVEHANRAGGVDGREVVHVSKDTGANPETAAEAYAELTEDHDVLSVVGPVISDVTASLTERAADDRQLLVSPSSTAPDLASAGRTDDGKFFARTCPNDSQQAAVMAKIVDDDAYASADTATVFHLDDAFGSALANALEGTIDADVAATVSYPGGVEDPAPLVDDALAPEPDAVAFVGSPGSSASVLKELLAREYEGDVVLSSGLASDNPRPNWTGVYTASVASANTVGTKRLRRELSDAAPLLVYTMNAYDAAMLPLLAGEYAGEASSPAAADALQTVSGGVGHSVTVGEFDRARDLVAADRELNYKGAAGDMDLTDDLEPVTSYLVQQVAESGLETLELLKRGYFGGGSGGGDA
ncbi:ABC transporter substrate-binding protein [Halobacterium rubrum]|uniref:ABC transporter substrate-binding protein n=1 Tax=Halobacterium TaxID=2239 RepID=UPI001F268C0E|nr:MULTISPECIES: ABC transporter substrate-binding protein [Halobacterium]MDH5019368.1 ABC transporter substrate-binding protein [Halobacterium rubrum]